MHRASSPSALPPHSVAMYAVATVTLAGNVFWQAAGCAQPSGAANAHTRAVFVYMYLASCGCSRHNSLRLHSLSQHQQGANTVCSNMARLFSLSLSSCSCCCLPGVLSAQRRHYCM
jgi:hypothetical protein